MKRKGISSLMLLLIINILAFTNADSFEKKATKQTTLTGKVFDNETGQALPRVNITLKNSKRETRTVSDPDGNFKIGALEPGRYTLVATSINYKLDRKLIVMDNKEQAIAINLIPLYNHIFSPQ